MGAFAGTARRNTRAVPGREEVWRDEICVFGLPVGIVSPGVRTCGPSATYFSLESEDLRTLPTGRWGPPFILGLANKLILLLPPWTA